MWIDIKTNPPPSGTVVLVKMDDGTPEMECYAVAEYNPSRPYWDRFMPANCHSTYDGAGVPALDFDVVSWKYIDTP